MTTVTSWMSVSDSGKRTFYLGADSLGSSESGEPISNMEKKVYISPSTAEIFAFSGDVGWGRHFLRELTKKIPFGKFNNPIATVERANEFCAHASARRPINAFTGIEVAYGARHEDNNGYEFRLFLLSCGGLEGDAWSVCRVGEDELASTQSVHVYSGGLGGKEFQKRQKWIVGGDQGQVARAFFWTLCDLVDGVPRNDLMTGGFPQLAKIDSTGSASPIGVVYHGVPTGFGSRVSDSGGRAKVWVDENFTQLKPTSLEKYSRAQQYARRENGR